MSQQQASFKYMVCSDQDKSWGITVDNVGEYYIEPDYSFYPPPRQDILLITTLIRGMDACWTITS